MNPSVQWPSQVLMKDAKTGKKVMFVPLLSSPSVADSTDPGFITAVQSNGGRNDIVVQRMCGSPRQGLRVTGVRLKRPLAVCLVGMGACAHAADTATFDRMNWHVMQRSQAASSFTDGIVPLRLVQLMRGMVPGQNVSCQTSEAS